MVTFPSSRLDLSTDLHFTPGRGNIDKTVRESNFIFYILSIIFIGAVQYRAPRLEGRDSGGSVVIWKDLLHQVREFRRSEV